MIANDFWRMRPLALLPILLSACQFFPTVTPEEMRKEFEDIGQLAAHAQHCGSVLDEADIRASLNRYAERRGLHEGERQKMVSYYETAKAQERQMLTGKTCSNDDRIREAALLEERLGNLK